MTLEISGTTQNLLFAEAERQNTDPELLARRLLRLSLMTKQRDLSHLAGTWSEEQYQAFEKSVASLQEVVEED